MISFIVDEERKAIEAASGGKNTIIRDNAGNPSIMVCVQKFNLEDVDSTGTLGTGVHPAFIVHGKEIPEIWISKYQNVVMNNRAYSLAYEDPATYVNFDRAKSVCENKGRGWHLMSRLEWAAIAQWCYKNGTMPRGNTNYGKAYDAAHEHGVFAPNNGIANGAYRVLTGSGPQSWNHDNTPFGISGLCGNVWEWNDGFKLIDGKAYAVGEDGAVMNNFDNQNAYKNTTGFVDLGVAYDSVAEGNDKTESNSIGKYQFAASVTNKAYTGDSTENYYAENSMKIAEGVAKTGFAIPKVAYQLGISLPSAWSDVDDYCWVRNYGERLPYAGGTWGSGSDAGVFALHLPAPRSDSRSRVGFRSAYIAL